MLWVVKGEDHKFMERQKHEKVEVFMAKQKHEMNGVLRTQ